MHFPTESAMLIRLYPLPAGSRNRKAQEGSTIPCWNCRIYATGCLPLRGSRPSWTTFPSPSPTIRSWSLRGPTAAARPRWPRSSWVWCSPPPAACSTTARTSPTCPSPSAPSAASATASSSRRASRASPSTTCCFWRRGRRSSARTSAAPI